MKSNDLKHQFCTFYIDDRLYGLDVIQVQEIAKPLAITPIHLAPSYVAGVSNLRGQIATAIGLHELFGMPPREHTDKMSMVCKFDGTLLSLLVDRIGDVIEVSDEQFETAPATMNEDVRKFVKGVYKIPNEIMSVIDMDKLNNYLSNHSRGEQ